MAPANKGLLPPWSVCYVMAHDANTARVLSPVPLCGDRCVFALVLVPDRGVRDQPPGGQVFYYGVAGAGVFGPVCDSADARVRSCAGLPAGGRAGEPDRAVAAGRSGLRGAAATTRRDVVEHCGGTVGERGAGARFDHP